MKKILTVSLFAIMAVSAANAEIASVEYVGKQTGALTDLQTTAKANLVGAINEVKAEVGTVSTTNGNLISAVEQAVSDLEDAVDTKFESYTTTTDMTNAIATAKSEAITAAENDAKKYIDEDELTASQNAQNTTLQTYADNKASAAQTAAEKTASDALSAAKTELEGKITNASSGASTALAEALQNYTTTTDMTAAIATAKSGAETTAANALAAYKSTNDAAVAAAQKAGDDAQATADTKQDKSTSMSIGAANGAWTDLTKATGYSTTGTHSLVLKDGTISWEKVSY